MNHTRVLTEQELQEARELRQENPAYYTKLRLARMFRVSPTAIWENIFSDRNLENTKRSKRVIIYRKRVRALCIPCSRCSICMTKNFSDQRIPINYQLGDICVTCYLEEHGKRYLDLIEVEHSYASR